MTDFRLFMWMLFAGFVLAIIAMVIGMLLNEPDYVGGGGGLAGSILFVGFLTAIGRSDY